jgi:hypothetical protein
VSRGGRVFEARDGYGATPSRRWLEVGTRGRVMAVYTSTDGYRHLHHMSRKTQVTLTDRQHAFLVDESIRTDLSLAELVRRAIDRTYRPALRPRLRGYELSLGIWQRPDAAIIGRRRGRRLAER